MVPSVLNGMPFTKMLLHVRKMFNGDLEDDFANFNTLGDSMLLLFQVTLVLLKQKQIAMY